MLPETISCRLPKIFILIIIFGIHACSVEEILEIPDNPDRLVRVVFSPNGLGDLSYNDDILRGILQEKNHSNFRLKYLSPANMKEAETIIKQWQEEDDPQKYYTIIAGSEFEKIITHHLPGTEKDNYIMFDTSKQDFTIPAFRFCGYGVSFLSGVAAYSWSQADTVAYMGGQKEEYFIEECYKGFRDGYLHSGGKEVIATYISEESFGFAMPDRAYQMADSLFRLYPFIYVMAGGSNNGVYQYLREHPEINGYTNGVDVDQSAYSDHIIGSMIKNIGNCIGNYIHLWMNGKTIPHYAEYGIRSGYTYFQVSETYKNKLEKIVDDNFELAILKEEEYEKENK